jgi:hypothetical protein
MGGAEAVMSNAGDTACVPACGIESGCVLYCTDQMQSNEPSNARFKIMEILAVAFITSNSLIKIPATPSANYTGPRPIRPADLFVSA